MNQEEAIRLIDERSAQRALGEGAGSPPGPWALAILPALRFFSSLVRRAHGGGLAGFVRAVNEGVLELTAQAKIYERWRADPERARRDSRAAFSHDANERSF
ncbi:MAG: hypothetical protein HY804_04285 [Nitrospinae bacterium]|nr:hypothetical protein [Nitrospinota bacterium]